MRIHAIEAVDFRNIENALVEPHPRFNVFSGDNAQGKTNLLEAVYLLGTLRSFRAAKTEELIRFGASQSRVRARAEKLGTQRLLEVTLTPGHKNARVDGKAARASDYFGGVNVVLFAPEDLRLPKGPPSGRRRFLDRAIWNAHPPYLAEVQTYERVLRSRNAVLRDARAASATAAESLLEVYDAQLAKAAVPIVARRARLVEELAPFVADAWARVTQSGLVIQMSYENSLAVDEVEAELSARLQSERARDRARGSTSSGPHTDDLRLLIDHHAAGAFASQGQTRALVLALKIAEIEFLGARLGDTPVLLLDDVSSELDATRNSQLFGFLRTLPCQAFITTTHPAHVLLDQERKDFQVLRGEISS